MKALPMHANCRGFENLLMTRVVGQWAGSMCCCAMMCVAIFLSSCGKKQDEPGPTETDLSSPRKKIFYVDSYHEDYIWSAGITKGIREQLSARRDVELKVFRMDTKRNPAEKFKKKAALSAKEVIDAWKPDIVITSDDNAAKYLIAPYYKNRKLPFVFCGLNWDVADYGFPCSNVTGMIEVQLVDQILLLLKPYARGERIAFLKGDDFSSRKEVTRIEENFGLTLDKRFVPSFEQWQEEYKKLQDESDMILLGNASSIPDWDGEKAAGFIAEETKVPTGNWDSWMAPFALITVGTVPEEQGTWAAKTALSILDGKSPGEIPLSKNKQARTSINMKLARKLNIRFPMELIERSQLVSAAQSKVLYVDSYHKGYKWSDGIESGLLRALSVKENPDGSYDSNNSNVSLRVFRMDTKLNPYQPFLERSAMAAKSIISQWQPDIIIVSDDNAAKYLIAEYYMDSTIPVVFCGVNWDASVYGFPTPNMTGMIEVSPCQETVALLRNYAKGDRLGVIGSDTATSKKTVPYLVELLNIDSKDIHLISDFEEWKREYLELQNSVDMLLWLNPIGIIGWNQKEAREFILANTRIPTGGDSDNNVEYALLGQVKIAEEQGWWAGKAALRILAGTPPNEIPIARNKQTRLCLNMELAKRLGIKFPVSVLEKATLVGAETNPQGQ